MAGYCIACDRKLRGSQRLYCSNACRKRYKRLTASYPGLAANRPLSTLFGRDMSALGREQAAIAVQMVIRYNAHNFTHESDGFALKSQFGKELQKVALQTLQRLFARWDFEIVVFEVLKK